MAEEFEQAGWANSNFRQDTRGNLIILFHPVQKKMKAASLEQQRPVFKEVIYITKIVPGQNGHVIDRPIREEDKEEFADKWMHYERTRENKQAGFPIENWHAISDTQKAEFKAMKIQTVEQFAALSDAILQPIMGGIDLRRKAQIFIEAGRDAELLAKVRKESDEKVADLTKQLADLKTLLEERTSPKREKVSA